MAHLLRLEPHVSLRVLAAVVSAGLHLALLFGVILLGGRYDGLDTGNKPLTQLTLIHDRKAEAGYGIRVSAEPVRAEDDLMELFRELTRELPALAIRESSEATAISLPAVSSEPMPQPVAVTAPLIAVALPFVLSPTEQTALLEHVARGAEQLARTPRTQVAWEANATRYTAALVLERAKQGAGLDRVVAEVRAENRGRTVTTLIHLKRLAFSSYAQVIDRWDPFVQLHDDEIVGRTHINSRFKVLNDGRTAPTFFGKVSTAARSFNTQAQGGRRAAEIFRGGVETRAGRVALPEQLQPSTWTPDGEAVRIHELANDTRIRFFADGSYTWRDLDTGDSKYRNEPSDQPVYFIATRDAAVYLQGVVAGRVLVYSPARIIIEDDLRYATDPRKRADSRDCLGLVSDRYVEVASRGVTGSGDLDIHAAIFARRGFIVHDIDTPRAGRLRIYGSLTAGTVSATEPRYATQIEYDSRFEEQRPPGFPSTDRFAVAQWDGQWHEATEEPAVVATAGDE